MLDLEFDYMVAAGIVSPSEDYEPLYYVSVQPDDERNVDVDRLARDSERLLAIPAAEAELILASETEYLAMHGLVTEIEDGEYPEESA